MMTVPTTGIESENRFMAYITNDKVGLHFLPATGNPHLAMALIAHPSGVSRNICVCCFFSMHREFDLLHLSKRFSDSVQLC